MVEFALYRFFLAFGANKAFNTYIPPPFSSFSTIFKAVCWYPPHQRRALANPLTVLYFFMTYIIWNKKDLAEKKSLQGLFFS